MPNVGFCGGSSVEELGPASDMQAFFGCVKIAMANLPHLDGTLLNDRLYRRYLTLDQLKPANDLIDCVRIAFSRMRTRDIDWTSLRWDPRSTELTISNQTLDLAFDRYLTSVQENISGARSFEKCFGIYQPVMTIISDLPRFIIDEKRPLSEYDALEGEPMWLR